jgi:hypothetical protein
VKITVKDGVIWEGDKIIGTFQADRIAESNGLVYAERFCEKYNGQTLELDTKLKVITDV